MTKLSLGRMHLTTRERRTLVSGVTLIFCLFVIFRGIPMWQAWQATQLQEETHATLALERAERSLVDLGRTRDSLAARTTRLASLAHMVLPGESPTASGANLAGIVAKITTRAKVKLGSVQVAADTLGTGAFARVQIRGDFTGDITGTLDALVMLERGPVLLAIRELSISQLEPGAGDDRPEVLHVEFLIEGLTPRSTAVASHGGSP
jgi:hypothetical protein